MAISILFHQLFFLHHKSDLIVLTGNLYGEVPSKILNVGDNQAEEALKWWKAHFGDDLYIELMRHGQEDEKRANQVLIQFAQKHDLWVISDEIYADIVFGDEFSSALSFDEERTLIVSGMSKSYAMTGRIILLPFH